MKYNDKNIEQKVLSNVSELLYEKGVKGWNMDQLSLRSGLAKNTLYRIIGSKEDVICKVVINHIKITHIQLARIMETEKDYLLALGKIVNQFPKLMNPMYFEYIQGIFDEYPKVETIVIERRNELTQNLISFIKTGIEEKKLRQNINPESLVELLQSIVISYIRLGYKGSEMTEKLSEALDYIVNGIK